jgi:hypothetical protein
MNVPNIRNRRMAKKETKLNGARIRFNGKPGLYVTSGFGGGTILGAGKRRDVRAR